MKCKVCGKEHDGTFGSGRFCSLSCSNTRYKGELGRLVYKKCSICGYTAVPVGITTNPAFVRCSTCDPPKVKVSADKRRAGYTPKCPYCGKLKPEHKLRSKYCSINCYKADIRDKRSKKIEEANGVGYEVRALKNYLKHVIGNKCSICGGTEWRGQPMPLVLDHINGKAKDNRLENLRLVCGNCDMQLPTYKSKNKNSQRKNRKGVW